MQTKNFLDKITGTFALVSYIAVFSQAGKGLGRASAGNVLVVAV